MAVVAVPAVVAVTAALLNFDFVCILYLNDHLMVATVASQAVAPARRSIKIILVYVVRHFCMWI